MEKVSIIVAYFNEEKFIKECIESLINQTYKNIEIILVNDGSTDDSLKICEEYAENDNRIKNYPINNSGVSVARNTGINAATGEYILFVDGDDWIEINTVEFALTEINKSESDILIWSYFKSYKNKEVKVPLISQSDRIYNSAEEKQELYMKSIYARYIVGNNSKKITSAGAGTVMCKLYKSKIIKSNNIKFDPQLIRAEDVVFALKVFQYAKKIKYINENLYHYRMSGFSATSPQNYMADADLKYRLLLERLTDFQDAFVDKEKFDEVFYARTIQALLWHLKHKYFHKDHPVNLMKMRKEVIELINREPFKKALKKADKEMVPKQEKLMIQLFKRKMILFYYVFQKYIEKRDKANSNKFE